MLATILFSDIVGSTARLHVWAIPGGGSCWASITRGSAGSWPGSAAWSSTRPGTGSSPGSTGQRGGSAVPVAIRETLRELGLEVRLGLHTGECEALDGKIARYRGLDRRPRLRAGSGGRGAGVADRQRPGGRIRDHLRRPRRPAAEGRTRRMAAVLRHSRIATVLRSGSPAPGRRRGDDLSRWMTAVIARTSGYPTTRLGFPHRRPSQGCDFPSSQLPQLTRKRATGVLRPII